MQESTLESEKPLWIAVELIYTIKKKKRRQAHSSRNFFSLRSCEIVNDSNMSWADFFVLRTSVLKAVSRYSRLKVCTYIGLVILGLCYRLHGWDVPQLRSSYSINFASMSIISIARTAAPISVRVTDSDGKLLFNCNSMGEMVSREMVCKDLLSKDDLMNSL